MTKPVHFAISNAASKFHRGMGFPVKGGRKGLFYEMLKLDRFTIRFDASPTFHKQLVKFLEANNYIVTYTMYLEFEGRPRYEAIVSNIHPIEDLSPIEMLSRSGVINNSGKVRDGVREGATLTFGGKTITRPTLKHLYSVVRDEFGLDIKGLAEMPETKYI
jgi:hypothetical protein